MAAHPSNRWLLLALALLACSTAATADNVVVFSGIAPFTVYFDGIGGDPVVSVPGLSAEALFTFTGFTAVSGNTRADFTIDLTNTSSAPITASRVSILGMDVEGLIAGSTITPGTSNFGTLGSGDMPIIGNLDICAKAGGEPANCAGGGGGGVIMGTSQAFGLGLLLSGNVGSFTLSNFAVRYQSIQGAGPNDFSAVGSGVIPEPSSYLLFSAVAGFLGLGLWRRRRIRQSNESYRRV